MCLNVSSYICVRNILSKRTCSFLTRRKSWRSNTSPQNSERELLFTRRSLKKLECLSDLQANSTSLAMKRLSCQRSASPARGAPLLPEERLSTQHA